MSAMVHQLKDEPVDLSDSDSDKLLIEESTCDTADEERWVRRSSRMRRSSTRFFDFFTGEEDAATSASRAAPKNAKNRTDGGKKSTYGSRKIEPEPTDKVVKKSGTPETLKNEPIDPEFLVAYVEKMKKVILPGQYSVKLPVGPGEFVNVDGAEYLRGLGYYDIDHLIEEEEVPVEQITDTKPTLRITEIPRKTEPAPSDKDLLRRRVEFEAQRVMMKSVANPSHRAAVPAPPVYRMKEVDEPDQFSSASAYSTDEDRDSDSTVEEIDVTGSSSPRASPSLPLRVPGQAQPYPPFPTAVEILSDDSNPSPLSGSSSKADKGRYSVENETRRSFHNEMEKKRRRHMATMFTYLTQCVAYPGTELPWNGLTKTSKVKILAESIVMIADLTSQNRMYEQHIIQLRAENNRLRRRHDELEAKLKGLKQLDQLKRKQRKQTVIGKALIEQSPKKLREVLNTNAF